MSIAVKPIQTENDQVRANVRSYLESNEGLPDLTKIASLAGDMACTLLPWPDAVEKLDPSHLDRLDATARLAVEAHRIETKAFVEGWTQAELAAALEGLVDWYRRRYGEQDGSA